MLFILTVHSSRNSRKKKTSTLGLTDVEDLDVLAFEEKSLQQWNLLPSEELKEN